MAEPRSKPDSDNTDGEAHSRWRNKRKLLEAAHDAADECRQQCERETEEPPGPEEAFVAGALWALGEHPEYDIRADTASADSKLTGNSA